MFTRTKKILASELMYALDKDEEEAESYLDELLADSATTRWRPPEQVARPRARGSAVAACASPGDGGRADRGRR